MTARRAACWAAGWILLPPGCAAAGVAALAVDGPSVGGSVFAREPAAARSGDGFDITFEPARPVDVTVRIVDAGGRVVRHLAAGMVGLARAAEPLRAASLKQRVHWDGRDDSGRPVGPGCQAVVAAGMRVTFEKFILGGAGFVLSGRNGRDVIFRGRDDEYYVAQCSGIHVDTCRVFDKDGRFLRPLFPYTPGAKYAEFIASVSPVFGAGRGPVRHGATDWDGRPVPRSVAHSDAYYLTPRVARAVVTSDGCVVATLGYAAGYPSITRWTADGFATAHFWRPPWLAGTRDMGRSKDKWTLAAGADGEFYLADGLHHVVGRFRASDLKTIDFTFNGNRKLDRPRGYLGELDKTGDDDAHFNGPDGVAVDAAGRLLVLDGPAVKTYAADGKFVARKPRADSDYDRRHVPIRDGGLAWGAVGRMEKARPGSSGVPAPVLAAGRRERAIAFPHFVKVDSTGRLYVEQRNGGIVVTDLAGKAFRKLRLPGGYGLSMAYMCVDPAGNFHVTARKGYSAPEVLLKFSPAGERLRFGDADAIAPEGVGRRGTIKGAYVTGGGDIYVVAAYRDLPDEAKPWRDPWLKSDRRNLTRIDVYAPDGRLKTRGIVRAQALNDVLVDRDGCIYTIEGRLRYKSGAARTWPPPFLPPDRVRQYAGGNDENKRKALMQRLLKFPAGGGALDGAGGARQVWDYPGVSGVSPLVGVGHLQPGQMCLDDDQRLWLPDTYNYCVQAVDRAGNLIVRVGRYGSERCAGGGGDRRLPGADVIVDPEVPLARPHGMAVHGDTLIIPDMMSHRVARCRIAYAERKTLALK